MIPVTQYDPTIAAANDNNPSPFSADSSFTCNAADVASEGGTDPKYGEVTWRTLISGDKTPSAGFVLGVAEFPAHGRLMPHRHEQPEFYYGLTGSGVVTVDGCEHVIAPGVAVYLAGNAEHGVQADETGLTFAYGFGTSAFSDVEYVFSAPAETG